MNVQDGCDYAGVDENNHVDPSASGLAFGLVRAGFEWGHRAIKDDTCKRDRIAWSRQGTFGAYMILGWDLTGATPEQQVEAFVAEYGDRLPGELPPSLDLEADSARAVGRTPDQCLAWAERAYDALAARYGHLMIYTSARVWIDVFGGKPSKMGAAILWVKIPYPFRTGYEPRRDVCPPVTNDEIPLPWRTSGSPGAWIEQYQGDARPVQGVGQADLDRMLACAQGEVSERVRWMQTIVGAESDRKFGPRTASALAAWQSSRGLEPTGRVDVQTLARLTA